MSLRMRKGKAEAWLRYYNKEDERKKIIEKINQFFKDLGFKVIPSKSKDGTLISTYRHEDFVVRLRYSREYEWIILE